MTGNGFYYFSRYENVRPSPSLRMGGYNYANHNNNTRECNVFHSSSTFCKCKVTQ